MHSSDTAGGYMYLLIFVLLIFSGQALASPRLTLGDTSRASKCWYVLEPELRDLGVTIEHNMYGNCQIHWNRWQSHAFQMHLHAYGLYNDMVYYVGSIKDGRQVFGLGLETSRPYMSIWYDPIVVEGEIFYAASDGYVGTEYTNTVVYGDQTYSFGVLGGIPVNGPTIWQGEPALIGQLEDGSWTVFVGNTPDIQSFPFVPRWGPGEPSIWRVRIKDGKLIYTAIDATGLVENYIWGECNSP